MSSLPEEVLSHFALHSLILAALAWMVVCCVRSYSLRAIISLLGMGVALVVGSLTVVHPIINRDAYRMASDQIHGEGLVVRLPLASLQIEKAVSEAGEVEASSFSGKWNPSVFELVLSGWVLGAGALLLLLVKDSLRIQKDKKEASALDDEEWMRIKRVHSNLQIPRTRILVSKEVLGGPCLVGLCKPCLLLPKGLLCSPSEHLRWALRHEEEHWRVGDSRSSVLITFIVAAFWWNPFLWLLRRQWVEDREVLCDSQALVEGEASDYGKFLLSMAREISWRNGLATCMVSGSQLQRRIRALLNKNREKRMSKVSRKSLGLLMVGGVASGFAVSCVGIGERTAGIPESRSWRTSSPIEPGQWSVTAKLVNSPTPGLQHGTVLTKEELIIVMRDYSRKKGADIITLPSMIPKLGEIARVELYQSPHWQAPANPADGDFVGVILEVLLEEKKREGEPSLSADLRLGFEKGESVSQSLNGFNRKKPINWRKIRTVDQEGKSFLKEGEVLVLDFGEVQKGEHISCFVILGKTS